jgi:hypothetical protein
VEPVWIWLTRSCWSGIVRRRERQFDEFDGSQPRKTAYKNEGGHGGKNAID